jgi:type I restriction enzyme S subunit
MSVATHKHAQKVLPPGWRWVRLGAVCVQDRALVDPKSEAAAHLSYLGLENIESQTGRILKAAIGLIADEGISTTFAFDARHVLYGKLRPYLNKVALPDFAGRCTTEVIPLLPKPELDKTYLCWLLRRTDTVAVAMRDVTGSRMPRADMSAILKHEIPLPPLPEQRRIAAILKEQMAAVDKARAAAEARLEAVKALPAAFLREVFCCNEERHWKRHVLESVAKTCSGSTPSRSRKDYFLGSIPWVKTGELKDNTIVDTEEHVSEAALQGTSIALLPVDTLLIAMYGQGQTRGRTALLAKPSTTNQACFAVLPNKNAFVPLFLQFWFMHNYSRLRTETEARGGNQPNFNGDYLKKQLIPLPSLSDQRRLAACLREQMTAAEQARAAAEAELDAINALPAALLRRAFNGGL